MIAKVLRAHGAAEVFFQAAEQLRSHACEALKVEVEPLGFASGAFGGDCIVRLGVGASKDARQKAHVHFDRG